MYDPNLLPFGAQYYRAPTPKRDQWARDLANMRRHRFNTIKIWAQWRWNNPSEGRYDFSDLIEIMDLAAKNDLRVIVNAIYDVAPAWFWRKHPDAAMIRRDGVRLEPQASPCRQIGGVPGPSYHHAEGMACRRAFTEAMAKALHGHPALYVWDLWNEPELTAFVARDPKPEQLVDYSPFAVRAFINWLHRRYQTLDALNESWNRNYQIWEEVEVPRDPGVFNDMIDWRMFFVDTLVDELRLRIDALRTHDPDTPVMVHTVPMPYFNLITCSSEEYALAKRCDLFGNSVGSAPFAAAVTTSAAPGKRVLNAEIHARYGSTLNPPPAVDLREMKRHIFVPLARGVQGFLFWQYRPETLGCEAPAWGLTDLEGETTPWLEHVIRINDALQAHAETLTRAEPLPARIAVVNSPRSQIFDWCAGGSIDRHYKSVYGAFLALYHHHHQVDVVPTQFLLEQDITRYDVIYYPFPYYMEDDVAARLEAYVRAGGALIGEAFFGGIRASDGLHALRMPGLGFDEVFGVREGLSTMGAAGFNAYEEIAGVADLPSDHVPIRVEADIPGVDPGETICGYRFAEELRPGRAEVLARFPDGRVAVTRAAHGSGSAICIGSLLAYRYGHEEDEAVGRLLAGLVALAGARPWVPTDTPRVRADLLTSPIGASMLVVTSDRAEPCTVRINLGTLAPRGSALVDALDESARIPTSAADDGRTTAHLEIAAQDVRLFRIDAATQ